MDKEKKLYYLVCTRPLKESAILLKRGFKNWKQGGGDPLVMDALEKLLHQGEDEIIQWFYGGLCLIGQGDEKALREWWPGS